MAFDGRYKLVKYANGADGLFDLNADPCEERNLAASGAGSEQYRHLDRLLWREAMAATQSAHCYNQVFVPAERALWADEEFGRPGWERPYPGKMGPNR